MTICRKCGKEIPDGQELCQDCMNLESNSGESYLDELLQHMEDTDSESIGSGKVDAEVAESLDSVDDSESQEPQTDDINELLDLLSKDYTDDEYSEDEETGENVDLDPEGEDVVEAADQMPVPEVSMFSDDDEGGIFADEDSDLGSEQDLPNSDTSESVPQSDGTTSVEDIFNEALSAVGYSEKDEDDSMSDFALDPFGGEEENAQESDSEAEVEEPSLAAFSEEELSTADEQNKQDQTPAASTKESFWKKTFGNIITEQTAKEEEEIRRLEEAGAEEKKAALEEKKKKKEEEKALKAEKAKAEKEQKAAKKAEQAAVKAAEKEAKKQKKEELARQEETQVVGKINPVGAAIVLGFFLIVGVLVLVSSKVIAYRGAVNTASKEFDAGNYEAAYEEIAGVEVSKKSAPMAEKVRICMQLKKEMNSYQNYYQMQMYLEALDSLMKGIRSYDANKDTAEDYDILTQYNELEGEIASELYKEFGVSETQARNINQLEDQEEYTKQLQAVIQRWQQKNAEDVR